MRFAKLKVTKNRNMADFPGFQGFTNRFSRVRKKTSKFPGFQGIFQGKEKIQGIFKVFKVFKDWWPPCSWRSTKIFDTLSKKTSCACAGSIEDFYI